MQLEGRIRMAPPKTLFRVSSNALAFAELVFTLSSGEYCREELVEKIGISDGCLRMWMKYLRDRKLVVICEYRRTARTGQPRRIYTWNHNFDSKDVAVPRKSQAQTSRDYRINKSLKVIHELGKCN